jgi:hypothetical protein
MLRFRKIRGGIVLLPYPGRVSLSMTYTTRNTRWIATKAAMKTPKMTFSHSYLDPPHFNARRSETMAGIKTSVPLEMEVTTEGDGKAE